MDIRRHIAKCKLLSANDKLLVAVSGGPDSVVLLDALCVSGFRCVVAHCNFHLRGEESDGDERFVESLARHYGVPFCKVDFDTVASAKHRNVSIEMAARDLRYKWFEQVADEHGCDAIVVAHNANDAVETFFLNLVRGTGIAGLTGIAPKRGKIVRPMLEAPRTDIMAYIAKYQLSYRVDATNSDTVYRRNKIRHELMPLFEEINPAFLSTMIENISRLRSVEDIARRYSDAVKLQCIRRSPDGIESVDIAELRRHSGVEHLLYEWLKEYRFSSSQVSQMVACLDGESGKRFISPVMTAVVNRGRLELHPNGEVSTPERYDIPLDIREITAPLHLRFDVVEPDRLKFEQSTDVAFFDLDKLPFQLSLRRWQAGDRMVPFGMKGRKKISDLLADRKMSLEQKCKMWLLMADEDVIWVVGVRADDRYKVTADTRRVLRVAYIKDYTNQ